MELNLIRLFEKYREENKEVALVTVISANDASCCHAGTMLLVDNQGTVLAGSLGNEAIQQKAADQSKKCIERGLSRKVSLDAEENSVEVFINAFCNMDGLIIAGAGTMPQNIHRFAKLLGYRTTIIDNRPEMLTKDRFPQAYQLLLGDIPEKLASCDITENTNIVIATHHHEFDEQSLGVVITSPARYIGVLGNSRRVAGYFKNLESRNIPEDCLKKVYSPIGLDLGGDRTDEIALAIMAELQAVKYQKTGGFISKKSTQE